MSDAKQRRPRQYRGALPEPDKNGNVRPRVGGHRFTVGNVRDTSKGEMQRRLNALKDFFDAQCESHGIDRWAGWCLRWAKKIEKGEKIILNVSPLSKMDDEIGRGFASEDAIILSKLREHGVNIAADDTEAIARGERQLRTWLDAHVADAVTKAVASQRDQFVQGFDSQLADQMRGVGPAEPSKAETRTFHQALQAYRLHIKATGKKRDGGLLARSPGNYIGWATLLEKSHDDFPLWQLDSVKINELLSHWRNRPVSDKTGDHISYEDAKHKLDCLWAVLTWLDQNERWSWSLPEKIKFNKTPVELDQDRKKNQTRRVSRGTYSPDQLAIIAKQLNTFEKMILAVSVNCGMQPAEIGRLEVHDFFTVHPETEEKGDWVIFDRPKTHEYGEWALWPEVAALLKWGIHRANGIGQERVVVTNSGVPWYREDWTNPETKFGKWWQAMPSKTDKHEGVVTRLSRTVEGFPRCTIKTLRKILPNQARPKFGAEISDLLNARKINRSGNRGGRDTDRYSDRLYDEAKAAIFGLEPNFRPFLDVLRQDEVVKGKLGG